VFMGVGGGCSGVFCGDGVLGRTLCVCGGGARVYMCVVVGGGIQMGVRCARVCGWEGGGHHGCQAIDKAGGFRPICGRARDGAATLKLCG
jgi:hypothetical protein